MRGDWLRHEDFSPTRKYATPLKVHPRHLMLHQASVAISHIDSPLSGLRCSLGLFRAQRRVLARSVGVKYNHYYTDRQSYPLNNVARYSSNWAGATSPRR